MYLRGYEALWCWYYILLNNITALSISGNPIQNPQPPWVPILYDTVVEVSAARWKTRISQTWIRVYHHHIQFQSVWFTCANEAIVFVTLSVVAFTVLSRHPPVFGIADTLTTVTGTCSQHIEKIYFPNLLLSGRGTLDPLFPLQSEHSVTVFKNTDSGHPTRDDWSSWWKVEADRWGRGGAQKATVRGGRWVGGGSAVWRQQNVENEHAHLHFHTPLSSAGSDQLHRLFLELQRDTT